MRDKLLLMSCRSPYLDDSKVYPPLGLLYLKSAVEQHTDVEVHLTDDYDLNKPHMFKDYKWVGISTMTPQRNESLRVLRTIKEASPDTKVIVGGPHAFHYFRDVAKEPYDYIVPRDGQRSLVKILKGEGKRIEVDVMNEFVWDEQPRPDRTSQEARRFLADYNYTLRGRKAGTMLTATGCVGQCTFCEDANTHVRWSNIDKQKAEMDDLLENGYSGVYLFDDLFAMILPKIKPTCDALKERDLIYRCNGQAKFFTKWGEDFASLLGDTGCVEIAFGHETGSQKILDNIRKFTTVEQNYTSIQYAKKHGIYVKSFILLGLPGEDWDTLAATEEFIRTGGMDDFQAAIYYPYKGTQIRDALDKGKTIDLKVVEEGVGAYGQKGGKTEAVVRTEALSQQDLLDFRDYLVDKYKPRSHKSHWEEAQDKQSDCFFDTHLKEGGT